MHAHTCTHATLQAATAIDRLHCPLPCSVSFHGSHSSQGPSAELLGPRGAGALRLTGLVTPRPAPLPTAAQPSLCHGTAISCTPQVLGTLTSSLPLRPPSSGSSSHPGVPTQPPLWSPAPPILHSSNQNFLKHKADPAHPLLRTYHGSPVPLEEPRLLAVESETLSPLLYNCCALLAPGTPLGYHIPALPAVDRHYLGTGHSPLDWSPLRTDRARAVLVTLCPRHRRHSGKVCSVHVCTVLTCTDIGTCRSVDLEGACIQALVGRLIQSGNKPSLSPSPGLCSELGILCSQQGPRQPQACSHGTQSPRGILSTEGF